METVEKAERSREIRKTPRQKSRCHSLSAASPVICAGTGHPIGRPIYRSGDARLSPYQEEGEALLMKAYERFCIMSPLTPPPTNRIPPVRARRAR